MGIGNIIDNRTNTIFNLYPRDTIVLYGANLRTNRTEIVKNKKKQKYILLIKVLMTFVRNALANVDDIEMST